MTAHPPFDWQESVAREDKSAPPICEHPGCNTKHGGGKVASDEPATKLLCVLSAETLYKSDCFDYVCWLEETHQRENVKGADFLVMASDGTTCWGKTFSDAVKVAMNHDKELYDAVKNLDLTGLEETARKNERTE